MSHKVALIRGDGIGPEITDATVRAVEATGADIEWIEAEAGASALVKHGALLPDSTMEIIKGCQAVLKGPLETPVGRGFRSANVALRQALDLYANVRPARTLPGVKTRYDNINMVVIRENTEGLYSGVEHWIPPKRSAAEAIAVVTRFGSERLLRYAFEYARKHGYTEVCVFHKANILKKSSGLFLEVAGEVAKDYPDVSLRDLIIDNACMQLVTRPEQFQVIATTNLFGDIVSDLTAGLIGGLGLAPGANLGENAGLFEAVHGTAPDIAGKGIANPTALMVGAVMMLGHLGLDQEASKMHKAILTVLERGDVRTGDLGGSASTRQYTQAVIEQIKAS